MAIETLALLLRFGDLFDSNRLPYMVVGAHAVMIHGMPRYSADIDFAIQVPQSDQARVREVLEMEGVSSLERRKDEMGERWAGLTRDGPPIEVFMVPPGPVYDREFARRVRVDAGGGHLFVIGPEDLVLRKLVNTRLRRAHDLEDAVAVLANLGDTIDLAYLRSHCGSYRVCQTLEEAVQAASERRA